MLACTITLNYSVSPKCTSPVNVAPPAYAPPALVPSASFCSGKGMFDGPDVRGEIRVDLQESSEEIKHQRYLKGSRWLGCGPPALDAGPLITVWLLFAAYLVRFQTNNWEQRDQNHHLCSAPDSSSSCFLPCWGHGAVDEL